MLFRSYPGPAYPGCQPRRHTDRWLAFRHWCGPGARSAGSPGGLPPNLHRPAGSRGRCEAPSRTASFCRRQRAGGRQPVPWRAPCATAAEPPAHNQREDPPLANPHEARGGVEPPEMTVVRRRENDSARQPSGGSRGVCRAAEPQRVGRCRRPPAGPPPSRRAVLAVAIRDRWSGLLDLGRPSRQLGGPRLRTKVPAHIPPQA